MRTVPLSHGHVHFHLPYLHTCARTHTHTLYTRTRACVPCLPAHGAAAEGKAVGPLAASAAARLQQLARMVVAREARDGTACAALIGLDTVCAIAPVVLSRRRCLLGLHSRTCPTPPTHRRMHGHSLTHPHPQQPPHMRPRQHRVGFCLSVCLSVSLDLCVCVWWVMCVGFCLSVGTCVCICLSVCLSVPVCVGAWVRAWGAYHGRRHRGACRPSGRSSL
jgi:hypothetical protein